MARVASDLKVEPKPQTDQQTTKARQTGRRPRQPANKQPRQPTQSRRHQPIERTAPPSSSPPLKAKKPQRLSPLNENAIVVVARGVEQLTPLL